MRIYIEDMDYINCPDVNPHWSVSKGLEDLQGIQRAGMLLIDELDKQLARRDSGERHLPDITGIAVSAIMVTSYAAEIAIKTLIAQTNPSERPPKSHKLLSLFDQLDHDIQEKLRNTLSTMKPLGQPNWIDANEDIRKIIATGSENFVEWRYRAERKSVSNGIPKGLINVAEVARIVTLKLVVETTLSRRDIKL